MMKIIQNEDYENYLRDKDDDKNANFEIFLYFFKEGTF